MSQFPNDFGAQILALQTSEKYKSATPAQQEQMMKNLTEPRNKPLGIGSTPLSGWPPPYQPTSEGLTKPLVIGSVSGAILGFVVSEFMPFGLGRIPLILGGAIVGTYLGYKFSPTINNIVG